MRGGRQTGRGTLVSHRMGFEARRRPEHGSRFQRFVEAVGISWFERKGNGGEIADLKVSDLESLNRKFLQKFSMNALGPLHFPFFRT